MLKRKQFAGYFNDFVQTRALDMYIPEYHRVLRKGIFANEQTRFITYVLAKKSYRGKVHDDIVEALYDGLEDGIFCWRDYGVDMEKPVPEQAHLLCLALKGKRISAGNFVTRWAYFLQYLYGEHSVIYGAVLGGGILAFLELTYHVLSNFFCIFFKC